VALRPVGRAETERVHPDLGAVPELVAAADADGVRMAALLATRLRFERLLRRSELPFHRSQGFHPKPRLIFALSLPLGVVGCEEVVELELGEVLPPEEIHVRLARQTPPRRTRGEPGGDEGKDGAGAEDPGRDVGVAVDGRSQIPPNLRGHDDEEDHDKGKKHGGAVPFKYGQGSVTVHRDQDRQPLARRALDRRAIERRDHH